MKIEIDNEVIDLTKVESISKFIFKDGYYLYTIYFDSGRFKEVYKDINPNPNLVIGYDSKGFPIFDSSERLKQQAEKENNELIKLFIELENGI